MNLDALVAPLRADVVSGAAVIARAGAAAMRRCAVQAPAQDVGELRTWLERLSTRVLDAQPALAPLVELTASVLHAVDGVEELDEARRAAAEATEAFRNRLEQRAQQVAATFADQVPEGSTVLTHSSSSTVRSALIAARGRDIRVLCLESRPRSEGHGLARTLAEQGIPVVLAVDAAAESLVAKADLVLLGADSLGDRGVVNKIGSRAIGRSAAAHSVPLWVAADRSKWLPPGFPQVLEDDRPPDEVWHGARGVRVWNRYFEVLPYEEAATVVTEDGLMNPGELNHQRSAMTLPGVIAQWAARRGA